MRALILTLALALPVAALAECPPHEPARASQTAPLFDRLATADNEDQGVRIASDIWKQWSTAPDKKAQDLLDKGVQRIGWGAFLEAETILTYLIDHCPDYAEGYNQRAFARFLNNDFDGALTDIERTLELEPRHFGALAGRGLTLLRQGRQVLGMNAIREAVAVHPWINERHLLPPEERI